MNGKKEDVETRKENLKGLFGIIGMVNAVSFIVAASLCIVFCIFTIPYTPEQIRAMLIGSAILFPLFMLLITMLAARWWNPVRKFIFLYESKGSIEKPIILSAKKALYSLITRVNSIVMVIFILAPLILAVILASHYNLHWWYAVSMLFAGMIGFMGMPLLTTYTVLRFTRPLQNAIGMELAEEEEEEEEEEELSLPIFRKLFYSFGGLLIIVSIWFGVGMYNIMLKQLGGVPVFIPTAGWMLIAGFVVSVMMGGSIIILATLDIVEPVRVLMGEVKKVSAGDLSSKLSLITSDEIGILAGFTRRMLRNLRKWSKQAKIIADDDLKNELLDEKIKGDLGESFSLMVENLRRLADQAQTIANDDLANPILTKVGKGTLGSATSKMVENLKGLSKQAESISKDELDNPILKEEAKGVLGNSFARMVVFLRGIAQKATIVAKGDLTPTIETKGTLSDAFKLMITSLKELAKRLKDSSNQIASATSQILTASQQQATGIEEEATQISQTATSAKQLATTSKQVTDLSNEISKSSISSVQMANSGAQAVDNAIAGMEKIRQSVLETSKKIEGLSEKGQAINEVVTLIDDIANQTNLLSLNASIEAARAGEAGKGFAVVADAIGKLADRTTKSTKDISDLIKSIQQDTSGCVMSMEESTKETEKGSSLAQGAGKAIKELVSSFEHVAQSAKEIVLASQQQTSGSTQISKGMMGIDDIMKQSAAGAKQSTESARELSVLAEELKKAVGQFKLGEKEEERV